MLKHFIMGTHIQDLKTQNGTRAVNIFNDDVTREKINRHLVDINDQITEEDIKNIKVTIPVIDLVVAQQHPGDNHNVPAV